MNTLKNSFSLAVVLFLLIAVSFANAGTGSKENQHAQKTSVIVVGHGAPAKDFPKLKEYFKLHDSHTLEAEQLEDELIHWSRNEKNDEYWAGFIKVVNEFKKTSSFHSVHYAFNEMCAPTVKEALTEAAKGNPDVIVLTSIMVTPGGGHSEKDIPAAIELFMEEHPNIKVVYAWPYDVSDISNLLLNQVNKFVK